MDYRGFCLVFSASAPPAILLMVQGQPILSPIEKTDLQFVVNTNRVFDKSKKNYYLLDNNMWLTVTDHKGSWAATRTLPKAMAKLLAGQNFDDVKRVKSSQFPAESSNSATECRRPEFRSIASRSFKSIGYFTGA